MAMSKAMRPLLGLVTAALACVSAAGDATAKTVDLRDFHGILDLDGDKSVSISEMSEFAKMGAKRMTKNDKAGMGNLMEHLDTNKDGSASLEEWQALKDKARKAKEDKARLEFQAAKDKMDDTDEFKNADTNGDGKLNLEELAHLMFAQILTGVHAAADQDGDGHLSYDEMTADHVMAHFSKMREDYSEEL